MRKLALLLLASLPVFAQTDTPPPAPPDPPACLSAPVTKGAVTLSCSMIDATGGADFNNAGYLLGLKGASSDTEVIALRIEMTTITNPLPDGTFATARRVVIVPKATSGAFSYAFSVMPTYDVQGLNPAPTLIVSITVQELKASSAQSF